MIMILRRRILAVQNEKSPPALDRERRHDGHRSAPCLGVQRGMAPREYLQINAN